MTKIFNLKHNPLVSHISNHYEESSAEIVECSDSLHLFIPITITNYWREHESCLLTVLRKLNVSINGVLTTSDQKVLEVKKNESHTYNHVIHNTPVLASHTDFISKINIINSGLTPNERQQLNQKIRSVNLWNTFTLRSPVKVSFLELMNIIGMSFTIPSSPPQSVVLSFPGGRVSCSDSAVCRTLEREIREEVNIKVKVDALPTTVLYHNIFDKLNDKFYHNILFFIPIAQSSTELLTSFKSNYEVSSLVFVDIHNERYKPIYKYLLRNQQHRSNKACRTHI